MKPVQTNEFLKVKGQQKLTVFDTLSKKAIEIDNHIQRLLKEHGRLSPATYRYWINELKKACAYREFVVNNIVALTGRAVIAQRLGGTNTYSLNLNYGALGTSSTAPAASDTQLGAEVNRQALASADVSDAGNGVAVLSFFWSKNSFTNSNVNEFGTVVDGTASANTGQLFSHVVFSATIDKTASKTITVDATYTIS